MHSNVSTEKKRDIMQRRKKVAEYFLAGKSQRWIGDELKVSQSTVHGDISAVMIEWKESDLVDIDAKISLEIQKINHLESRAWDSFFISQKVKSTTVNRQVNRKPNKTRKEPEHFDDTAVSTVESGGDAKFLNIVSDCIKMRVKLLGLDVPQKIAITDTGGNDVDHKERTKTAIGELAGLIRTLEVERNEKEQAD